MRQFPLRLTWLLFASWSLFLFKKMVWWHFMKCGVFSYYKLMMFKPYFWLFFFLSNAFKALASSLCRLWHSPRLPTNFHSEPYTGPRQSPSAGVHLPPSLLRGLPSESAIHPGTWNLCGESYRFCFLRNHKQGWPSFGGFLFPRFHQSFPVGNCVTTPVLAPREKRFKDMTSVSDF